ncbi:probable maltase [Schistocerca cancellata]|uniref:probable maltase n=1 Tax=Schistocerca cancellata TaxID=274614 RepID=UPI002118B2D5|nr:probable maltase [Schistocerca cancellata]
MATEMESASDMNDAGTQLLEEEKRPTVLPLETAKKAKPAGAEQDDGATEKLVSNEKINSNKDASEVKFLSADSQNGDAKIDIENLKLAFTGMTKEELMKFANDPFWIRLRWLLFVLFWLLWVAMLAGAIAIIVMAPKCAPPAPLKWWEEGPLYEIYVRSYKDGGVDQDGIGDLKGVTSEVKYIDELDSTGIILSSIFKSENQDPDAVESFTEVDPIYGSLEDFKELLSAVKNRSLHLVLNFIPNHTSKKHPWFIASENGSDIYSDYYVWAPSKGQNDDGEIPPNNWVSVNGGSAWEWSSKRGMFYLHQFGKDEPDLNMRNPKVVAEIKKVLQFWLELGVSGFQLENVEFLLEDEELKNETPLHVPSDATHLDWDFYTHLHTTNLPGIVDILIQWKEVIASYGDDRILMVKGNASKNALHQYAKNNGTDLVDLVQPTETFTLLKEGFTADDLNDIVKKVLDSSNTGNIGRPVWQLSGGHSERIATRVSREAVDGLTMIVMLLPGTPITLYGDELAIEGASNISMPWNNSSQTGSSQASSAGDTGSISFDTIASSQLTDRSHLNLYKDLVKQRESPSIMYGSCDTSVINGTVFVMTRIKSGNPGILVAFNPSSNNVTVNLNSIDNISEELTVQLQSSNFVHDTVRLKSKIDTDEVPLPARAALVLSFVPKLT